MFGLEKKEPKKFKFDLEVALEKEAEKKRVLGLIDEKTNSLKSALREGTASENFDKCGMFLQAYSALKRVVERTTRK